MDEKPSRAKNRLRGIKLGILLEDANAAEKFQEAVAKILRALRYAPVNAPWQHFDRTLELEHQQLGA
jgi:hypothetical protein